MHTSPNIFERILAALTFFTRLPLGSRVKVSAEAYQHVVPLWPLMGWLTGGLMAGIYALCRLARLDVGIAVVLALASRVMLTGALHEDGLADFCDGFGGRDRNRTLEIMKDSHIGTYGVLGLVLYYLLISHLLTALMQGGASPLIFIAADALCKYLASTIIYVLPYARRPEEAKSGMVYASPSTGERVISLIVGLVPLLLMVWLWAGTSPVRWIIPSLVAAGVCAVLIGMMRRRIGGYTGDCCGATFLLVELTFYMTLNIIVNYPS